MELVRPVVVELFEDAADVFVGRIDGFSVAVIEVLEGRDGIVVEAAGFHVVDSVDAIAALADPAGLGLVVFLGVGHGGRIGHGLFFVTAFVARRGFEGKVRRFVGEIEEERFFVRLLEPIDGEVGEDVGVVTFEGLALAVDVEHRVEVFALPAEGGPIVEAFARGVAVFTACAHLPRKAVS